MKKMQPRTVVITAVIILTALVGFMLLRKKPVTVEWQVISGEEALETVLANGRVAGSRITPLALVKSGIVAEIRAEENTFVQEGDTLIVLDNRGERNRVRQQAAELAVARINLKKLNGTDLRKAREELRQAKILEETEARRRGRSDTLFRQGSITREAYDEAVKSHQVRESQRIIAEERVTELQTVESELRRSQVEKARLLLEEAQIELARTVLLAPAYGSVVDVLVERGAFSAAGADQVLFLPSDSVLYIEALVDESDAGRIAVGQRALVATYNDPDTKYDAVVRGVTGRIDTDRGTATVRLGIRSNKNALIADQTVSVQIITGRQGGANMVEKRFCIADNGTDYVFVKQGNRARKTVVERTDIGNGRTILKNGVAAGDTVVFAPELADNRPITLQRLR